MSDRNNIVQFDQVNHILEDDPAYVKDFCGAAITSFETFKEEYTNSLKQKDLASLRKAGHRIKPVSQMIGVDQLMKEYGRAKKMLEEDAPDSELQKSSEYIQKLCDRIIADFEARIAETQ